MRANKFTALTLSLKYAMQSVGFHFTDITLKTRKQKNTNGQYLRHNSSITLLNRTTEFKFSNFMEQELAILDVLPTLKPMPFFVFPSVVEVWSNSSGLVTAESIGAS